MGNSVAFIIPRIGKGGAERVVVNLANQMAKDGLLVKVYTILSAEVNYPLSNEVKHIHLEVECVNKIQRVIKRFIKLRKLIKADDASTIIAFDRYYGICCSLFTGKRVIGSERNDPYSNMPLHSFQKYFRDLLYQSVDFMIFQTEYAKGYFNRKIQENSTIIPNPVSTNILPIPFNGGRDKVVVTACRLTKQKNIPMMIDAFLMFEEKHQGYKLVIYGEGVLLEQLRKYISVRNATGKVCFPGYVNDLPERINRASMYVSSSDYEGISNSMLEALAMGIPTICTDCPAGGAAMVIQDDVNGYLVPIKNTNSMYLAMCRVVEEPEHTNAICKEAVKVRDTYSIKTIAKMWEDIVK